MPHGAQFTASPLSRFHRSMPLEEWRVRRVDWRESLVTRSAAGTTLESRQMNRRSASAIARSPKKNDESLQSFRHAFETIKRIEGFSRRCVASATARVVSADQDLP